MTRKRVARVGVATKDEKEVRELLAEAWDKYVRLPRQPPVELSEFMTAIHTAQGIVAIRVARRADPTTWPPIKP